MLNIDKQGEHEAPVMLNVSAQPLAQQRNWVQGSFYLGSSSARPD
jgi:hypothetical protein